LKKSYVPVNKRFMVGKKALSTWIKLILYKPTLQNKALGVLMHVGLMHTRVYHFSCPGAVFMHNS
jgi:hypothetical protein